MTRRQIRKIKDFFLGLFVMIIFFGSMGIAGYIENHYTIKGTVDYYKGTKCFVDVAGYAWEDDRVEEYNIGDDVVVRFNTNTTDNTRLDDVVEKITLAR